MESALTFCLVRSMFFSELLPFLPLLINFDGCINYYWLAMAMKMLQACIMSNVMTNFLLHACDANALGLV